VEELVKEISMKINEICIEYIYFKRTDVIEKTLPLTGNIGKFLDAFLRGTISGLNEEEYTALSGYVGQIAQDYVEAAEQRDMVLMIDTLDFGLRELLNLYRDLTEEETNDGTV